MTNQLVITGYGTIQPDKRYELELQAEFANTDSSRNLALFAKKIGDNTYQWSYQGKLP